MSVDEAIREAVRLAVAEELAELRRVVEQLSSASTPSPAPLDAEYLSPDDAAALAGVKAPTIRRWVSRGDLRGYRAGRLLRIKRAELQALLARPARAEAIDLDAMARRMLLRTR